MSYTYAGQYGPEAAVGKTSGGAFDIFASQPAYVYLVGTITLATLYSDRTKAQSVANPTTTTVDGNLTFFADPGRYDISINNKTLTVSVGLDAMEPTPAPFGGSTFEEVVVHGAVASVARPAGASIVHWVGSIAPTNAAVNDSWTDTANKILNRWNGSSFDALSAASLTSQLTASGDTTGATDLAALNALITTVSTAGGGIIDLVGTYWINAPIIWKTGVALRGQGWKKTIISLASGANCDMVQADTTLYFGAIRDLVLDGFKENQTAGNGINLNTLTAVPGRPTTPGGTVLFIERVLVRFCKQKGFTSGTTGSGSVETRLTSLYAWANDAEGIYVDGSDAFVTDCTAGDNMNTGIYLKGGGVRAVGCKSWASGYTSLTRAGTGGYPTIGNSSAGYEVRGENITMSACEAQDNAGVGFNFGADTCHATACNADANRGGAYQLYINGRRQVIDGVIGNGTSHNGPSPWAVNIFNSSAIGNKIRLNWPDNTQGVTSGITNGAKAFAGQNDIAVGTPNSYVVTTYAATVTPDPFYGGPEVSLTGNITFANPATDRYVPNMEFEIHTIQDVTGGRTHTWGADYIGMTTADTTANKTNVWKVRCRYIGGAAKWYQVGYQAF